MVPVTTSKAHSFLRTCASKVFILLWLVVKGSGVDTPLQTAQTNNVGYIPFPLLMIKKELIHTYY